MGAWAQNVQTSHQVDFEKKKTFFKIGGLSYMKWKVLTKIKKYNFCFLTLLLGASPLWWGKRCAYMTNFLEHSLILYLPPFLHRQFGLKSWIIFMKEFASLTMGAMETEKRQFLSYHSNGCFEGIKTSSKTWIL